MRQGKFYYTLDYHLGRPVVISGLKLSPNHILVLCRFPKPKDEGWFILLGDLETQDLLALKRLGSLRRGNTNNHQLTFTTPYINQPEVMGHHLGSLTSSYTKRIILTLYLISDAYIGLDQQYELRLEVVDSQPNN